MRKMPLSKWVRVLLVGMSVVLTASYRIRAEETRDGNRPTTAQAAAKALDFSTFPIMDGAEALGHPTIAQQNYRVSKPVQACYEFVQKGLIERGFQETPGAYSSADYTSGMFEKQGYIVSLSVTSSGEPKQSLVNLLQHGNVDLAKLPVPKDAKPVYQGPASSMVLSESSPEEARKVCAKLLGELGWEPYGVAGDSLVLRNRAVQLNAYISAAPAQDNKTMITYSAVLMSLELPAPADAVNVQYSESPIQLAADIPRTQTEVVDYYRQALQQAGGWKQTTENPVETDVDNEVIFRDQEKNMLTLKMSAVEGTTRVLLGYQSAAELKELDAAAKLAMAARMQEMADKKAKPKLVIDVPQGASEVKVEGSTISYQLAGGKAQGAVQSLRKQLVKTGWKEEVKADEGLAGAFSLRKGDLSLTITYTDTGFLPAEVSIDGTGVELERSR